MINPIATEAINSATYVDNYIDSVENLPDDVQRQLSRIRDIDVQYRGLIRDVDHFYDLYLTLQHSADTQRLSRAISRMHQSLIQAQELGDEKMQIVNHLQEIIDTKLRLLDQDQENLDIRDEILQQREHLAILNDSLMPLKQSRTLSPAREHLNSLGINGSNVLGNNSGGGTSGSGANKDHYGVGAYASSVGSSGGIGGGNSTPTSERSGNLSNGANGSGIGGIINSSNSNLGGSIGGSELQRSGSKRSRRRNESLAHSNNIELGGNESNSANETGSNGGERIIGHKSGLGVAQKKGATQSGANGTGGGTGGGTGAGSNAGKKKKRKVRGGSGQSNSVNAREETPPPEPIDPDEPTYCVCNQISFGEMILCDNDLCPIEWFHFSCVSLVLKPKGKWFCPNCRGERPNVMKPKAQFLKELERYNKEKEEKT